MAKKKGELDLKFVVDTSKPVKNLTELNKRVEKLRDTIEGAPLGSEEFKRLTAQLQTASSEVKVLEKNMEGLEPQQKAEAFLKMGEGIAGAFAVGQGAMGLMGVENENLEKIQVKVQSAIAIATGIRMMSEAALMFATAKRVAVEKFGILQSKLGKVVTLAGAAANWILTGSVAGVATGMSAGTVIAGIFRLALLAIPIVAIVMGIGALIAAFTSWFGTSDKATESTIDYGAAGEALNKKQKEWLETSRSLADHNRELAATNNELEKSLLRLNRALTEQEKETKSNNDALAALKEMDEAYYEWTGERNDIIQESIELFEAKVEAMRKEEEQMKDNIIATEKLLAAELKAIQEKEDADKAAHDRWVKRRDQKRTDAENLRKLENELLLMEIEDDDLREQKKNEIAKEEELRDADKIRDRKIREATIANINQQWNIKEIERLEKLEAEKQKIKKASVKELLDIENDYRDELLTGEADYLEEYYQSLVSAENQEKNAVIDKYFELIERADEYGLNKADLKLAQDAEMKLIDDAYREEEAVKDSETQQAKLDAMMSLMDAFSANMDSRLTELDNAMNRELDVEGLTEEEKEKINKKYQKKKDKIAKRQKAIQASQAIINTFVGATRAVADLGPVAGPIAAAAIVLGGLASVRQIYAQDVGDGGGGGGGGVDEDAGGAPQTTGSFKLSGETDKQDTIKAYVVTDEMTDSQSQLEDIRETSTI